MGEEQGVKEQPQSTFERTVDEGARRLRRSVPSLLATGAVGGIDVSTGVFGLLLVSHETGSTLLGALAFSIGFIALELGRAELFTENFLLPVSALAAGRSRVRAVFRLWGGTLVMNLAAGWVMIGVIMGAAPELHDTAVEVGRHFPEMGIGWRSFASAVLGGAVITLMTWLTHGTESVPGRLVAAVSAAFLLAGGHLAHAIVASLEMFAALQAGAPFGYLDFLGFLAWASLGNMVGGLGLVTVLRLVQVGARKVAEERGTPEGERSAGEGGSGPVGERVRGAVEDVRMAGGRQRRRR